MKKFLVAMLLFVSHLASGQKTQYGFLLNDVPTAPAKTTVMRKMLFDTLARWDIRMPEWTGTNQQVQTLFDSGFRVVLNINGSYQNGGSPMPWPSSSFASSTVNSVLNVYSPELVVVENEEDNPNYHSGPDADYITELAACIPVVHSHGKKIANAGLTWSTVIAWMYHYYVSTGNTFQANAWKELYIDPYGVSVTNALFIAAWTRADYFLTNYATLALDYVNVHVYAEPGMKFNPHVFEQIAIAIKAKTGKDLITNEFGVRVSDPLIAKRIFVDARKAGLPYAIFYSGDSATSPSFGLTQNGFLNTRGKLLANYILGMRNESNYRVTNLVGDNSFTLDDYNVNAISDDSTLSAASHNALVTEFAVAKALQNIPAGGTSIDTSGGVPYYTSLATFTAAAPTLGHVCVLDDSVYGGGIFTAHDLSEGLSVDSGFVFPTTADNIVWVRKVFDPNLVKMDWYNVKNGYTGNILWPFLKAKLHLLPNGGGTIQFGAGTFLADPYLTIDYSNIHVVGAGSDLTIINTPVNGGGGLQVNNYYRDAGWKLSAAQMLTYDDASMQIGQGYLDLRVAGSADSLKSGDIIFVNAGASHFDQNYGEFNIVDSIIGTRVYLKYSLSRNYSQAFSSWGATLTSNFTPPSPAATGTINFSGDQPAAGSTISIGNDLYSVVSSTTTTAVVTNIANKGNTAVLIPSGTHIYKYRAIVVTPSTLYNTSVQGMTINGHRKALTVSNTVKTYFKDVHFNWHPSSPFNGALWLDGDDGRDFDMEYCQVNSDFLTKCQFARSFSDIHITHSKFFNAAFEFSEFNSNVEVTNNDIYTRFSGLTNETDMPAITMGSTCNNIHIEDNNIYASNLSTVVGTAEIQIYNATGSRNYTFNHNTISCDNVGYVFSGHGFANISITNNTLSGKANMLYSIAADGFNPDDARLSTGGQFGFGSKCVIDNNSFTGYVDGFGKPSANVEYTNNYVNRWGPAGASIEFNAWGNILYTHLIVDVTAENFKFNNNIFKGWDLESNSISLIGFPLGKRTEICNNKMLNMVGTYSSVRDSIISVICPGETNIPVNEVYLGTGKPFARSNPKFTYDDVTLTLASSNFYMYNTNSGAFVKIPAPINPGYSKKITIDQPNGQIFLQDGNTDVTGFGIARNTNNSSQGAIFSGSTQDNNHTPVQGLIGIFLGNTAGTLIKTAEFDSLGSLKLPLMPSATTAQAVYWNPSTGQLTHGAPGGGGGSGQTLTFGIGTTGGSYDGSAPATINIDTLLKVATKWDLTQISAGQTLTFGPGTTGGTYNGSTPITMAVDTFTQVATKYDISLITGGNELLTFGDGTTGGSYDGSAARTINIDTALQVATKYDLTLISGGASDTSNIVVINIVDTPLAGVTDGALYLVSHTPPHFLSDGVTVNPFYTHEDNIAEKTGSTYGVYVYTAPENNQRVIVTAMETIYKYDGISLFKWLVDTRLFAQNGAAWGINQFLGPRDNRFLAFQTNAVERARFWNTTGAFRVNYWSHPGLSTDSSWILELDPDGTGHPIKQRQLTIDTTRTSGGSVLSGDTLYIPKITGGTGITTAALTFNNSGTGDASGTTFNGSAARTLSYNSIGAQPQFTSGNGYIKITGTTISYDNSTFLTSTLTNAHLLVGNGSNIATDVPVSGDVTLANTGAFTIANNAVSNAKLRQSAGLSIIGNSTNATANVADITGADHQLLRVAGTTLGFGTVDSSYVTGLHTEPYYNTKYQLAGTYVTGVTASGNIASSGGTTPNITFTGRLPYANLTAPTTTSLILGRGTTGGDWQEITLGTNLSMSGTTLNATGGSSGTTGTQPLTATGGQTAFTYTTVTVPASYDDYFLDVNGIIVKQSNYSASGNVITMTFGLVAGDILTIHRIK